MILKHNNSVFGGVTTPAAQPSGTREAATGRRNATYSLTVTSARCLFQPAPNESDKRFDILLIPKRRLGIRKVEMSSPPTRYNHLGRRAMDLHRSIAPPFHRIPAVGLDMIGYNQGEKGGNLYAQLAPTFSAL